jgi:HEAT repeat protein
MYKRLRRIASRWNNEVRYLNLLREIFVFVQSKGTQDVSVSWFDRYFLRRLVLAQMDVMEADEQVWLRELYRSQGFYDEDRESLQSRFWWVRLAALVRLETCRYPEILPWLEKLIDDPNDFVALVAMRALSQLRMPQKLEPVLDALSRRAPSRRDLFIELLTHFGEGREADIVAYLGATYDPYIAAICIEVLGALKGDGVREVIENFASSSDDGVAESVARALGELGDDQSLEVLRQLSSHDSAFVRAAALRSLARLNDPRLQWVLQEHKDDESLPVKRILYELQEARLHP